VHLSRWAEAAEASLRKILLVPYPYLSAIRSTERRGAGDGARSRETEVWAARAEKFEERLPGRHPRVSTVAGRSIPDRWADNGRSRPIASPTPYANPGGRLD
jgi:hypothetical protein